MITGGGNSTTWQVTPPAPVTVAAAANVVPPATQLSFLGYGLDTPFRRGAANDFAAAGGPDLARSRIRQILGTACSTESSPGELLWRGDFGARLVQLRHRSNNVFLAKLAQHWVMDALAKWEPSTRVRTTAMLPDPSRRRSLNLRVGYDLVTTSPAGNRVAYPQQTLDVPLAPTAG